MHEFRIFCTRLCSAAANTAFTSAAVRTKSGGMEALLKLNIATLALIAIILPIFAGQFWGPPWTVARVAGLAVAISSFLLLALARIQLGQAFSVQAKATTLVTSGIYSRIRNPIYIFGGLTIAGFILWANQPWLLLLLVVLIPMQVYRIRKEERVLTEKFGVSYLDYKRQTWF
jgi:protein-S-isoprenylcysteine O-methyltransferase Ste14